MSGFIEGENRSQSTLFADRVDDYADEDGAARAIDVFVDRLDLSGLGFKTEPADTGRPGYNPATMLKIFVYGYMNKLQSSRRLEAEARRNVELMWLTGRLAPDFKTIADFRKDNGEAIRLVCREFVMLCRKLNLFANAFVAIDGARFRAVNTRDKNFTKAKLKRRLQQIDESIDRYLNRIASADRQESEVATNESQCLKDKISTLEKEMDRLNSHDRHLLDSVCTHMADIDYGELRIYPGNYASYLAAATRARDQLQSSNAKKSAELAELQQFVDRFSANASRAKQASSRARKMGKIKLDQVKASSRRMPCLSYQQEKKLHREALVLENLSHGFDDETLFSGGNLILEAGAGLAVIGENNSGKTTFLRCLMNQINPNQGVIKWSENATLAYCPQDSTADFDCELNLFDWISQWRKPEHDDQMLRSILGRLLFSAADYKKEAAVCSGGEKNRLLFAA